MGEFARFDDLDELRRLASSADEWMGALSDLPMSIEEGLRLWLASIELDIERVHLLVVSTGDIFWDEIMEKREAQAKGSDIGVRIRRKSHATEISYYKKSFRIIGEGVSYFRSEYLKKSPWASYLPKDLRSLYSWEQELILEKGKSFTYCRNPWFLLASRFEQRLMHSGMWFNAARGAF